MRNAGCVGPKNASPRFDAKDGGSGSPGWVMKSVSRLAKGKRLASLETNGCPVKIEYRFMHNYARNIHHFVFDSEATKA